MKMQFDVTYQDGRKFTSTATPKDFIAFERQYNQSAAAFTELSPIEWLYYLAWSPLHRGGQEPGDFDAFLTLIDEVEAVKSVEVAAFPTEPSPETFANSPS